MLYEQQHSWWFGSIRHSAASLPGEVRQSSPVLLPPVTNVRADDTAYQKNSATVRNRGSPVSSKRRAAPITCGTCVFMCNPRSSSRCCASGVRNSFFWNRSPAFAHQAAQARNSAGPRAGSKTAQVVALLQRKNGATLADRKSTRLNSSHLVISDA